ncbi:hypothetical protein QT995_24640 [Microcoleus sp. S36b_A3]|uniref:hypothetical protein n=1 Tax=unclassified Microcoleus TaxID=2642155 RepID=UPI002FD050EE
MISPKSICRDTAVPCPGDGLALVPTDNHLGLLYEFRQRREVQARTRNYERPQSFAITQSQIYNLKLQEDAENDYRQKK